MTIENTTARDPLIHLAGAMGGDGLTGYIEDMEARGQRQVVASEMLPARAPWDDLEALGFKRGDPVPGDELFCRATLPEGWKKQGSDHAMWSYVVDEHGRRRVGVFYKAAYYDRQADAYLETLVSYLRSVAYGDQRLVLDDSWATAAAVAETATRLAADEDDTAARYEGREAMVEYAAEHREHANKLRAIVSSLPKTSSETESKPVS